MSDTKRPGQGSLFDYDKDDLFGGNAPRQNSKPESLFGDYVPPTPRQSTPAQNPVPTQSAPRANQQYSQQRPANSPPAQGTPQQQAPPRPAAPGQQASAGRPPAPRQQAVQRPQAPAQSPANGATQVLNTPAQAPRSPVPAQGGQTPGGQGQVYRQADSGQRLSQFAPKPAAEQAVGPNRQPQQPAQTQMLQQGQRPAQSAADATRVMNQPGQPAANKAFAGFEDATRVGEPIRPAAQNPSQNPPNQAMAGGATNHPAGGGSHAGGSNGNRGGKGGKGKNGKSSGNPNGKTVAKYVFINIGKFALTCLCIGVIIASILFVQIANYVVESTADDDLVLDLDALASSQTGYMWAKDANGEYTIEYMQIVGESNFKWTDLSNISPYVIDALISTEDKSYYSHSGVSWSRTAYAGLNEIFGLTDKQFGASTITQQLVKNLTGDSVVIDKEAGASAGYMRKMREIFRAIGINNSYSKQTVLEAYLNTMPLTGTIKGVGAGAYEYFGKTPAELELHEAATIVGITNWPTKYSPYSNPENCLERRNDVLYFMYQDEVITKQQFDAACAKELGLVSSQPSTQNEVVTSWYADAAIEQVLDDLADKMFGGDRNSASTYFYNAGLNVELNVDLDIQKALEDMYLNGYNEDSPWPDSVFTTLDDGTIVRPQSAMTIMDYEGNVLASAGGIGEKTVSRALNRASTSRRQVGSTMKGIAAYPLGLEYNLFTYSTNLMDSYSWYSDNNPNRTDAYDWPTNYGNKITNSSMGLYTAFAQSTNTVAVRVGLAVGMAELYDFSKYTMGLTHLQDDEKEYPSSLVLGGQSYGATTEQMAAAYAIYGNGGQYHSARYYTRVLDSLGNVVLRADDYTIQAVSEETAYIMNRMLYNVVNISGGTANGMGVSGFETIGKTGTTSDDNDRWFVGMTPYYVAAIWWGYDYDYTLYGYSPAASTNGTTLPFKTVMDQIHEGLPEKSFPEAPEGVRTEAFCRVTGLLATEECGERGTGYYKADNLPEPCVGHSDTAEGEGEAA